MADEDIADGFFPITGGLLLDMDIGSDSESEDLTPPPAMGTDSEEEAEEDLEMSEHCMAFNQAVEDHGLALEDTIDRYDDPGGLVEETDLNDRGSVQKTILALFGDPEGWIGDDPVQVLATFQEEIAATANDLLEPMAADELIHQEPPSIGRLWQTIPDEEKRQWPWALCTPERLVKAITNGQCTQEEALFDVQDAIEACRDAGMEWEMFYDKLYQLKDESVSIWWVSRTAEEREQWPLLSPLLDAGCCSIDVNDIPVKLALCEADEILDAYDAHKDARTKEDRQYSIVKNVLSQYGIQYGSEDPVSAEQLKQGMNMITPAMSTALEDAIVAEEQQQTDLIIDPNVFSLVVREVTQDFKDYHVTPEAVEALQTASEAYLIEVLRGAAQVSENAELQCLDVQKYLSLVRR